MAFLWGQTSLLSQSAYRYGKGRAANESETKPPNLDKKPNFKTANGRRVPLTDLLGLAVPAVYANIAAEKQPMILRNILKNETV